MQQLIWKLLLCLLPILSLQARQKPIQLQLYPELSIGYRQDNVNWNIAGTDDKPNILSELEWDDLRMVEVKGSVLVTGYRCFYARAFGDYAWILHGRNQDSDYNGDNRTDEYCRSVNDAGRGHAYDFSVGLGYQLLRWCGITLGPVGGYSWSYQQLHMFNGKHIINAEHEDWVGEPVIFNGVDLDSTYKDWWNGPWVGVDGSLCFGCFSLVGEWEYHWTHFEGRGHWNLRSDLDGDLRDSANGHGMRTAGRLTYRFCKRITAGIGAEYWTFRCEDGKSVVNQFVSITTATGIPITVSVPCKTRFNEVNWHSFRINAVIGICF